jgi:hypothetical protein
MLSGSDGRLTQETRTFTTMTDDLLKLSDWLSLDFAV